MPQRMKTAQEVMSSDCEESEGSDRDAPNPERSGLLASLQHTGEAIEKTMLCCDSLQDDDFTVDFVMVFPRQVEQAEVLDPLAKARDVFEDVDECEELSAELQYDSMSNEEYHEIMRKELVRRLTSSAFSLGSFISIDQDEVFLKIGLPRSGNAIERLAEKYLYWMPFKRQAYQHFTPDSLKGSKHFDKYGCPLNDDGDSVPAYHPFDIEHAALHRGFTDIDCKRIAGRRITELLNIWHLQQQGLLLFWFVAAEREQQTKLGDALWGYDRLFEVPQVRHANMIREYFGEQVALFFQWNSFFTENLAPVAVFIFVVIVVDHFFLHSDRADRDMFRFVYMASIVVWAQLFKRNYEKMSARAIQKWGMKEYDTRCALTRPEHKPGLDRTNKLKCLKVLVYCSLLMFSTIVVSFIALCERLGNDLLQAFAIVAVINVGYPVWCMISRRLVRLQNHRTEEEYNNALAFLLSGVKMLTTLFPFLHQAFAVPFQTECDPTSWEDLASKVYCMDGPCHWPSVQFRNGSIHKFDAENITQMLLRNDQVFSWKDGDQYCMRECFPTQCEMEDNGRFHCTSHCWDLLKDDFEILYFTHIVGTMLMLIIPRALAEVAFRRELWKMRRLTQNTREIGESIWLQKQAKKHVHASYQFGSWGGSFVEDFLQLMTSFMLFVCFGALYPPFAIFAFLCHCVEYRLLIKRMLFINGRPFPLGADGIGIWQGIMSFCIGGAVMINVGLAIVFLDPIRSYDFHIRLLIFMVVEHGLFFLMYLVSVLEPDDVKSIEVYNNNFIAWIKAKQYLQVDESELKNNDAVDIGLGASLSSEGSESSE